VREYFDKSIIYELFISFFTKQQNKCKKLYSKVLYNLKMSGLLAAPYLGILLIPTFRYELLFITNLQTTNTLNC